MFLKTKICSFFKVFIFALLIFKSIRMSAQCQAAVVSVEFPSCSTLRVNLFDITGSYLSFYTIILNDANGNFLSSIPNVVLFAEFTLPCSGNYKVVVDETSFNCFDPPPLSFTSPSCNTISTSSSTLCQGDNITIGNCTSGQFPNSTISWRHRINSSFSWATVSGQTSECITGTAEGNSFNSNNYRSSLVGVAAGEYQRVITHPSCPGSPSYSNVVGLSVIDVNASISGTTTICNGGSTTLTASGGSTYLWNTGSSAASIVVSPSSTTTYTVTATISGCQASAARTVIVNSIPGIPTGTSNSRCGTGTVNLTASGCSGGTINWYDAMGTTLLGSGTTFTTPSISSTTAYQAKCSVAGCESGGVTVTATINSVPSINGIITQSRCGSGSITLGASATSGTLNWYNISTGGTIQGTGTSFVTPFLTSTTTYYVEATANGCTSARTAVTATVIPIPGVPTGTSNSRCGTGTVNLTASGCSGGTINWYDATGTTLLGIWSIVYNTIHIQHNRVSGKM